MQTLKKYLHRYFIDAMGAMALGLFASLLIGTIFGTVGKYTGLEFLDTIANYAKAATGMAIGVAIAYKLQCDPLVIFSAAAVGAMSNAMGAVISQSGGIVKWAATANVGEGNIFYSAGPAGAFFAVIIACEIGRLVSKKTKVDILATPVSPELLPPKDGEIAQCTESLVGPYELHDYFIYHTLKYGCGPREIYEMAKRDFKGVYENEVILGWLRVFSRRFFSQQFKRSCMPDGPKVTEISVSPRCDLRMPSDSSSGEWMRVLDEIEKEEA